MDIGTISLRRFRQLEPSFVNETSGPSKNKRTPESVEKRCPEKAFANHIRNSLPNTKIESKSKVYATEKKRHSVTVAIKTSDRHVHIVQGVSVTNTTRFVRS